MESETLRRSVLNYRVRLSEPWTQAGKANWRAAPRASRGGALRRGAGGRPSGRALARVPAAAPGPARPAEALPRRTQRGHSSSRERASQGIDPARLLPTLLRSAWGTGQFQCRRTKTPLNDQMIDDRKGHASQVQPIPIDGLRSIALYAVAEMVSDWYGFVSQRSRRCCDARPFVMVP